MDRPRALSPAQRVWRLVWNPDWNEALFVSSLAERMLVTPEQWLIDEIEARLMGRFGLADPPEIRLYLVTPDGMELAWPHDV